MMMIFQRRSSSPLFVGLTRILNHHPTILPPPMIYSYRFFRCHRYPKCTVTFKKEHKKIYHEKHELCVPLAERKGYKNKNKNKKLSDSDDDDDSDNICDSDDTSGDSGEKDGLSGEEDSDDLLERVEDDVKVVKLVAYKDLFAEFYTWKVLKQTGRFCTSNMASPVPTTTGFWPSYKSFDLNIPSKMIPVPSVDENVDKDRRYGIDASIVRIMRSCQGLGHQQWVMDYVNKLSRMFMIPLPPVDENVVEEDVDKDRRYGIDASIVRIMRSCQVLGHQQWVMDYVEKLSCMFKRDYMERDKDNLA